MKKTIAIVLLLVAANGTTVIAQKKKGVTAPQVASITQDAVIKSQNFRLVGPFRGGRAAAAVGSYTESNLSLIHI